MKKILCLLLALTIIFALCSCGKTDYNEIYHQFMQEEIIPNTEIRSSNIADVDRSSMNWDGYEPQPGFAFSYIGDLSGDGIPELIIGEETECADFFNNENIKNSALKIKVYGISERKVTFIDETEIPQLLPLFSFVDITFKDSTLFVSGIGAWAGDPPFNDHYIIKLENGKLVQEKLSTMDMFITTSHEELSKEEREKVYDTYYKLTINGFGYKAAVDLEGRYDPSATRIAFYSLFGEDGRSAEYFGESKIPEKGFHRYFYDYYE